MRSQVKQSGSSSEAGKRRTPPLSTQWLRPVTLRGLHFMVRCWSFFHFRSAVMPLTVDRAISERRNCTNWLDATVGRYYNTTLNFTELFRKRHIFSQMLVKADSMARCLILHTCDNKTLKYLKSSIKMCGLWRFGGRDWDKTGLNVGCCPTTWTPGNFQ